MWNSRVKLTSIYRLIAPFAAQKSAGLPVALGKIVPRFSRLRSALREMWMTCRTAPSLALDFSRSPEGARIIAVAADDSTFP
jgi:hypothetical protein